MTDEEFKLNLVKFNVDKRKSLLADQMLKCMQHFGVKEPEEVYRKIINQESELSHFRDE